MNAKRYYFTDEHGLKVYEDSFTNIDEAIKQAENLSAEFNSNIYIINCKTLAIEDVLKCKEVNKMNKIYEAAMNIAQEQKLVIVRLDIIFNYKIQSYAGYLTLSNGNKYQIDLIGSITSVSH